MSDKFVPRPTRTEDGMSETLREWVERLQPEAIQRCGGECVWIVKYDIPWDYMLDWLAPLLDAPIIRPAGPDAKPYIVTREAWETFVIGYAGLCCLTKEECRRRQSSDDATFDEWWTEREVDAHAILTALGPFVVADEVVEVRTWADAANLVVDLNPGDTIAIKRRESEDCDE